MNVAVISGRCTADPQIIILNNGKNTKMARITIAVKRKFTAGANKKADFISCVAFGPQADFIDKYMKKGSKADIRGHIQTGKYEKNGNTVYTTDVFVEDIDFGESKKAAEANANANANTYEAQPAYNTQQAQAYQAQPAYNAQPASPAGYAPTQAQTPTENGAYQAQPAYGQGVPTEQYAGQPAGQGTPASSGFMNPPAGM